MVVVWVRKTIIVTVLEDANMWCNIPHSLKNNTLQLHSTAYCSGYMVDIVSRCILTCGCANTCVTGAPALGFVTSVIV